MRSRSSEAAASVKVTARIRPGATTPSSIHVASVFSIRYVFPAPAPAGTMVTVSCTGRALAWNETGYDQGVVLQRIGRHAAFLLERLRIRRNVERDRSCGHLSQVPRKLLERVSGDIHLERLRSLDSAPVGIGENRCIEHCVIGCDRQAARVT